MTYTITNPDMLFWAVVLWTLSVGVLSYGIGYSMGKRAHLPTGAAPGSEATE